MTHWAVGIDEGGRVVLDRAVENDAQAIDALVAELRGLDGEVVIGLDVVGSFARFLEAMLLAEGFELVHAPGIAVNRAGQGFAGGERKSDPRDARTIADLVRTRDLRGSCPTTTRSSPSGSRSDGGASWSRTRPGASAGYAGFSAASIPPWSGRST